jgi:beta-alanine degradation protein BauB
METKTEPVKTLLENERVTVREVVQEPGTVLPMHSHGDYVVFAKTPGKMRFRCPDGTTEELELHEGEALFRPAESHEVENVGDTRSEVLVIDLK